MARAPSKPLGIVIFVDGSGWNPTECFNPGQWPEVWSEYVFVFLSMSNPLPGYGKNFHHASAKTPSFLIECCGAIHQVCKFENFKFYFDGFSRGAMFGTWMAKHFPQWFDGMFLAGPYPLNHKDPESMRRNAQNLIRVAPRMSVLHSPNDVWSNCINHADYWDTIVHSKVGNEMGDRVNTFRLFTDVGTHDDLRQILIGRRHPQFFLDAWMCQMIVRASAG